MYYTMYFRNATDEYSVLVYNSRNLLKLYDLPCDLNLMEIST